MYTTYRNIVFMLKPTNNVVAVEKKRKEKKRKGRTYMLITSEDKI